MGHDEEKERYDMKRFSIPRMERINLISQKIIAASYCPSQTCPDFTCDVCDENDKGCTGFACEIQTACNVNHCQGYACPYYG